MSEKLLTEMDENETFPWERREVEGTLKNEVLELFEWLMKNSIPGNTARSSSWSIGGIKCNGSNWEVTLAYDDKLPGIYDIDIEETREDAEAAFKNAHFTVDVNKGDNPEVIWHGDVYTDHPDLYEKIIMKEFKEIVDIVKNKDIEELRVLMRRSMLRIV